MNVNWIHTPLEPLNIHYHDFEDIELADPDPSEQLNASTISTGRKLNHNIFLRRRMVQKRLDEHLNGLTSMPKAPRST